MGATTTTLPRPAHAEPTVWTDVGMAGWAAHGEDRVLVRPDLGLYGVFDGVGLRGAVAWRRRRLPSPSSARSRPGCRSAARRRTSDTC